MRLMSFLLETYPPQVQQLNSSGDGNHSQELFSGFYFFNCMLFEISRKQEFLLLLRDKEDGAYDDKDVGTLNPRYFNLIGKDPVL